MSSYLQIENITKSYGDLVLFENISFQLTKGRKVALIAKNGAGKSTLFNILCGKDSADNGSVSFHADISIGFLEQEPVFDLNQTVFEHIFHSESETMKAIRQYEESILSENNSLMEQAIEKMDALKAWDYENKIKQILSKLKIKDLNQPVGQLSGGQKKRVALATALIDNPDLLVLDEPTNHLDLDMIEWLEEYLTNGNFTLLMVTHDRYFLDRVCNEIIEIDNKSLFLYKGNYSYYLEKRSERIENDQTNVIKARNLLRTELDWIRRMPKARGTKAKYRVDAFEDLKKQAAGKITEKQVNIYTQSTRLGSKIIDIKGLNKSFGDIAIIKDFTYNFNRFEKAGIIGFNGSGKSTFLNLITGNIIADSGTIEVGETITFGYYKQDGIQFDEKKRVIDVANDIAEVVSLGDGQKLPVSAFLTQFLFPPETQYSYVYKLSGGEKRRLYLATVLMKNPNFLILDEPTNDLDILTLNVLEEYIKNYQGCVIIVSHDRYFMDKLVDHLFVFKGEGVITDFPGNYSDFRYSEAEKEKEKRAVEKLNKKEEPAKIKNETANKKISYKEKQEFEKLTAEIEQLEKEKKLLENDISQGQIPKDDIVAKSIRIGEIISFIDKKTERWLELSELMG